jgi:uncharacterized protein YprB with RNaseH-like and TPR domain
MLSEELRARIAQLNRDIAWRSGVTGTATDHANSDDTNSLARNDGPNPSLFVRWRRDPSLRAAESFIGEPHDLSSVVAGEVVEHSKGTFYRVRRSVVEVSADEWTEVVRNRGSWFCNALNDLHPELQALGEAFPHRSIFLDLETCGFSGTPLFLVGLLRPLDGTLVVEQLLARNYAEEPAVLAHLWSVLASYDVLITFNGKSFDWPFLVDRSVAHRLKPPPGMRWPDRSQLPGLRGNVTNGESIPKAHTHCDLLHLARRYWKRKHELKNCRLQTLEYALCGRRRRGDIPSYLVGDAYHRFVRTGDARHLEQVLHHNCVDLITLAQLSLRMLRESVEACPPPLAAG